jgi:hypothetical protein
MPLKRYDVALAWLLLSARMSARGDLSLARFLAARCCGLLDRMGYGAGPKIQATVRHLFGGGRVGSLLPRKWYRGTRIHLARLIRLARVGALRVRHPASVVMHGDGRASREAQILAAALLSALLSGSGRESGRAAADADSAARQGRATPGRGRVIGFDGPSASKLVH